MSAPFVPDNGDQLAGYLTEIVKDAAKQYPGDESFARGVAAIEALDALRSSLLTGRRCHNCGATSGLRLTFGSPLALDYKQYECADGCRGGAQ